MHYHILCMASFCYLQGTVVGNLKARDTDEGNPSEVAIRLLNGKTAHYVHYTLMERYDLWWTLKIGSYDEHRMIF